MGEPYVAIKKLRRVDYKTILTDDEDEEIDIEYVLGANWGLSEFNWDEVWEEFENCIDDSIQNNWGAVYGAVVMVKHKRYGAMK